MLMKIRSIGNRVLDGFFLLAILFLLIQAMSSCQKICKMYHWDVYAWKDGHHVLMPSFKMPGDSLMVIELSNTRMLSYEEKLKDAQVYYHFSIHDSVSVVEKPSTRVVCE